MAEVDGRPVGYLLAQPDGSGPLRRSHGGRSLLGRLLLQLLELRQPRSVRILFMGVDPEYRRRGYRQAAVAADAVGCAGERLADGDGGTTAINRRRRPELPDRPGSLQPGNIYAAQL